MTPPLRRPLVRAAADTGLSALALLDGVLTAVAGGRSSVTVWALLVFTGVVLLARRRWPVLVALLVLPGTVPVDLTVAPFVALFTVAVRTDDRRLLTVLGVLTALAAAVPWPLSAFHDLRDLWTAADLGYALATAAAPIFFGQLVRARRSLAEQLDQVRAAQEQERRAHAEAVLARERARIAREMHDVVSHQVSLVAVHSGALQVSTADPAARDAASTIRTLAVATLTELRGTVGLLRASSECTAPQPTVADLDRLVETDDGRTRLHGTLPDGLSPPVQRALYRTVQESLTNVRKHAPGAATDVRLWRDGGDVGVTVRNGAPERTPIGLPGSGTGLVGLRERAEALGGTLTTGPDGDGGFTVELRIPRAVPSGTAAG